MESLSCYLPQDRREALASGLELPERRCGAVLFADISGFTALTKTLARLLGPRQGAEQLSAYLDLIYDALIAEVERFGGSVIGFAGDAITCWFEGDDGLVATASALQLQQAMERHARIVLRDSEPIDLGMTVAIASGPARRWVVGAPTAQRFDILAGQTLDRMAQAEEAALRGEVVLEEATALRLGEQLVVKEWRQHPWRASKVAVVERLSVPAAPSCARPTPPTLDDAALRPWVPQAIYHILQSGQRAFLTELRPVVALFLGFSGIDYEADAAGAMLDSYIRWVQEVVARYEGTLLQITLGDKGSYLYVVFGAPVAHENDAERAVNAAYELCHERPPHGLQLQTYLGITQGIARSGSYGGATRRTYGVLGNVVNLAAHLMEHARPDRIVVTAEVRAATKKQFIWQSTPPLSVKGSAEDLAVFTLGGRQTRRTLRLHEPSYALPILGREAELTLLEQKLALARQGQGQLVFVKGEAGIGKSRLLAELIELAQASGLEIYTGECQSYGLQIPYLVWESIWLQFFHLQQATSPAQRAAVLEQELRRASPELLPRLPLLRAVLKTPLPDNELTASMDTKLRKESLEALLIACLRARARQSPLLLVLEDCHWIDPVSLELLDRVARAITAAPVMVLVSERPHAATLEAAAELRVLPHAAELLLGPLPDPDVAELIALKLALQGQAEASELAPAVEYLSAQTHGNPFYIDALLSYIHDRKVTITDVGALRSLDLPDSVHRLVLSRIDQLSEGQRLLLKSASIVGRSFKASWLAGYAPLVGGVTSAEAELGKLVALELIAPAPVERTVEQDYLFRHSIIQEVTYQSIGAQTRVLFHEQFGHFLEERYADELEPYLDLLAYHYQRSEIRDKALLYLERAAGKAQREYANQTAMDYYRQALKLEQRWVWQKELIEILHILGDRAEEQRALDALARLPETPAFELAYLRSRYYEAIGDHPQAVVQAEHALEQAKEAQDPTSVMRALAQLGWLAWRQASYDQAQEWYNSALALIEAEPHPSLDQLDSLAFVLGGLGSVYRGHGEFAKARSCYERALATSRAAGNRKWEANTFSSLGVMALYQHQLELAHDYHQQALELRQLIGDRIGEGGSLYNLALVSHESGNYGQMQEYLLAALAMHQQTSHPWEEANVWNALGVMHQELGALDRARDCLTSALALSRRMGDEEGVLYTLGNLALVLRDAGDLANAEALFLEGLALADKHKNGYLRAKLMTELALVGLLDGDYVQSMAWASQALASYEELGLPAEQVGDLATLALASLASGRQEAAAQQADRAFGMLEAQREAPQETAPRNYFACFQVYQALGRNEQALAALGAAYRLVDERAAKIGDPDARQSFLTQVQINRAIVREASAAGLSPSQP